MLKCIATFIRAVSRDWGNVGKSYVNVLVDQLKTYLQVGWRDELVEGLNLKTLLQSGVLGLDPEEAKIVMEEFVWYFMTKKHTNPKYLMEEKQEYLENELKGLDANTRLWREGMGSDVEGRLRAALEEILLSLKGNSGKSLVEVDEVDGTMDRLLKESEGPLGPRDKILLLKTKDRMHRIISKEILNKMKKIRERVIFILEEHTGLESVEPTKEDIDKGVVKETPIKLNIPKKFDIEEINAWVKRLFSVPEQMVYLNLTGQKSLEKSDEESNKRDPVKDEDLASEISKEMGKEIQRQRIVEIRKKVLQRVKDEFFSKESIKPEKKIRSKEMKLYELNAEDLKDFKDFVKEELTAPTKGKRAPEKTELILSLIKAMSEKEASLKAVAEEMKVSYVSIKNAQLSLVKLYEKWFGNGESKEASYEGGFSSLERLRVACMELEDNEAVRRVLADLNGEQMELEDMRFLDLADLYADRYAAVDPLFMKKKTPEEQAAIDLAQKKFLEKGKNQPPAPASEKPAEVAPAEDVGEEDDTGGSKGKGRGKKKEEPTEEEMLAQLKRIINVKVLKPHKAEDLRFFRVAIDFKSKFDWDDIGHGKFDPKFDADEGWVQDDPHFEWESFNASIDTSIHPLKVGKTEFIIKYDYKQKLHDNGTNDGEPVTSLVVTKMGGKEDTHRTIINESGSKKTFRSFLDEYFDKVRELGLPMEGSVSCSYKNTTTGKTYHNTASFRKAMGGLAVSDSYMGDRVKQYAEFDSHRRQFRKGPSPLIKHNVIQYKAQLKSIMNKVHVSNETKKEAQKMLDLTRVRGLSELQLNQVHKFIRDHYKEESNLHKDVNIFDL